MLDLHSCTDFSLVVASKAHSVAVPRFLSLVAFLAGEQGLWGTQASVAGARGLSSCSSWALEHSAVVVVHRLSCSPAFVIFLDQGLSYCIGRQILCHWATREALRCYNYRIFFLLLWYMGYVCKRLLANSTQPQILKTKMKSKSWLLLHLGSVGLTQWIEWTFRGLDHR